MTVIPDQNEVTKKKRFIPSRDFTALFAGYNTSAFPIQFQLLAPIQMAN
jgi:hypothetical protein